MNKIIELIAWLFEPFAFHTRLSRKTGVKPRELLGKTMLRIDARGCMAHDHRVDAIGVVTRVYQQDSKIWIAQCADPFADYGDFTVLVPRVMRRTKDLYVEII